MQKLRGTIMGFGLRHKLILAFTAFIVLVSFFLSAFSLILFSRRLSEKNLLYVSDITYQTVNTVTMYAQDMENITFSVLSSNEVQENLRLLNSGRLSKSEVVMASKRIEDNLLIHTLYNNDIISLSVIADNSHTIVSGPIPLTPVKPLFTQEDLYAANGTALWGLVNDESHSLCVSRAILDLKTQQPIGSVNLVFRQSYIGNIMNDISISYDKGSYLLDDRGIIVSSNLPERIGQQLQVLEGQREPWNTYEYSLDGIPSYVYKGRRMDNGWTLATIIPKYELARETRWFLTVVALVDGLVILLAILTVWRLVKRMTAPLDRLCRSMEEVGQGNFEKREIITTDDEIGMLSRSYNEMVDNIESLIEHVYMLEISNRQAELEYLKMQINPHFLYNTLDTISWMARMEQKEDIADVAIALASLLRSNIKQDGFIPISLELENIRNYLLIQKYRFGSKLTWKLLVEPECEGYHMPNFILQPLVENAIIHGLEPKQTSGKLMLSIKEEEGRIKFIVADDGVGIDPALLDTLRRDMQDTSTKSSIGLKNADRRLRLHFGAESALHLESDPGIGTRVFFSIAASQCRQQAIPKHGEHRPSAL